MIAAEIRAAGVPTDRTTDKLRWRRQRTIVRGGRGDSRSTAAPERGMHAGKPRASATQGRRRAGPLHTRPHGILDGVKTFRSILHASPNGGVPLAVMEKGDPHTLGLFKD